MYLYCMFLSLDVTESKPFLRKCRGTKLNLNKSTTI